MQENLRAINELINAVTGDANPNSAMGKSKEQKLKEAVLKAMELPNQFTGNFIQVVGKKATRAMVQFAQTLNAAWFHLLHNWDTGNKRSRLKEELEIWLTKFNELLRFHFPKHFNILLSMPLLLWEPLAEVLEEKWQRLEEKMKEEPDPEVWNLIRSVYQEPVLKKGSLSYHQADYWAELLDTILEGGKGHYTHSGTSIIFNLIRHNFNEELFIYFMTERYSRELEEAPSPMQHWSATLRMVNRIPVIPDTKYDLLNINCKELLMGAIQQEIMATEQLNLALPAPADISTQRIHTNLSVSQLAALFRVLVECDIITSDNYRELMRMVASYFKTNRASELSDYNLYIKFYTLEQPALSVLHTHLTNMLRQVEKLQSM